MSNADRTQSLDAWEIVDAADGRRWLGCVEEKVEVDGIVRKVRFSKSLEYWPLATTAIAVPQMQQPNPLAMRQQAPQMGLAIQNVQSDASTFSPPLGQAHLPPWTLYNPAGSVACKDLSPIIRDSLLKGVQGIEAAIEKALHDLKRTNAAGSALKLVDS